MKKILALSFIEGGCVMAVELMGAKMLAPYFGSSLYVWASVLATTLLALTSGYFAGGILSEKENTEKRLYIISLLGGIYMMLMPFITKWFLLSLGDWQIIPASLFSSMLVLFPPVFLMGMVSPLIITLVSPHFKVPGRAAGTIYAISTLGGILATFLFGFYVIPEFGLVNPCRLTGALFMAIPVTQLIRLKWTNVYILMVFIVSFMGLQSFTKKQVTNTKIKVLYRKEGILGQVQVLDYLPQKDTAEWAGRVFMINRIVQSAEDTRPGHYPYLEYVQKIDSVINSSGIKSGHILVCGLGGGSLTKLLALKGYKVDAVEFDARIAFVAKEYFNLPQSVNVYVDDARHYINTCTKKYDIILFDLFKGEENPGHIITLESLTKLKSILNADGLLISNNNGYISGKLGTGSRSVCKTLESGGFSVFTFPVELKAKQEDFRNLLWVAALNKHAKFNAVKNRFHSQLIRWQDKTNGMEMLLTDDRPALDYLNANAAKMWRYYYIQKEIRYFNYLGIDLFE